MVIRESKKKVHTNPNKKKRTENVHVKMVWGAIDKCQVQCMPNTNHANTVKNQQWNFFFVHFDDAIISLKISHLMASRINFSRTAWPVYVVVSFSVRQMAFGKLPLKSIGTRNQLYAKNQCNLFLIECKLYAGARIASIQPARWQWRKS